MSRMRREIEVYDEDGSSEVLTLPTEFVVCWRCQGVGSHDCWEGGMTGDEMAEQGSDFFDDYMSGMYDAQCRVCKGLRVLEVVAKDRLTPEVLAKVERHEQEIEAMRAEQEAERRMGC